MLRDVFYYGSKPNVHPREQYAENLDDARQKATTEHFWIINEYCDYRNFDWDFDFEFLPDEDVWAEEHNNVWPSQHQKDSGTWLCPKEYSELIIYRGDVDPVIRKNEKQSDNWVELDLIDHNKFDFSWHPDPTDPPYIYKWGCKFYPAQIKHVLEYRVSGATQEKYMNTIVELLPQEELWVEHQQIDKHKFDMSWRPNPLDPPFIYVWGNKYVDGKLQPTLEYHAPNATDKKYMPEKLEVLPEWDKWVEVHAVDKSKFDFSWRPDPREPNLIYVFGNQHYDAVKMPTLEYHCEGATERKYMDNVFAKLASNPKLFEHLEDSYLEDYSWRPDPDSPPYIYVWGNQWNAPEDKISVQFVVEGATEYKYMNERAVRNICMDNWIVPDDVDTTGFDFSWEPSPAAPPFIYEFGTQWQKTGGPKYVVPNATETQYVDFQKVKKLPSNEGWTIPDNIDINRFDFSWHPDSSSPPYVYVFATQWAFTGGPVYTVPGATEFKYIDDQTATAVVNMNNWEYDIDLIDIESFDFSWHPYVEDQPYIYQFGTQWQKTGGPRYITPGATANSPVKYIDTRIIKAKRLPNKKSFTILDDLTIENFDYSWHPDETEEPYNYVFGNNQYPAEIMPTIEYRVNGAEKVKYIRDVVAKLGQNKDKFIVLDTIDEESFDFSWVPNPNDPPYVYVWGNQYYPAEIYPTVEYRVLGATEKKYMQETIAKIEPDKSKFKILHNIVETDFDFSWRPNPTDGAYIYVFGNTLYPAEEMPTVEYHVEGATETKYVTDVKAKLAVNKSNWKQLISIDESKWDFSWVPNPNDPAYIYVWGNQWNPAEIEPTIQYVVEGATEYKYMSDTIAHVKADKSQFKILHAIDEDSFDFSWRPNPKDPAYVYVFGNKQHPAEIMPTVEYKVSGATQIKYVSDIVAKLAPNRTNYKILEDIIESEFDFSWVPNPKDPPYIYVFGNSQYPGSIYPTVEYHVKGATDRKYVNDIVAKLKPNTANFNILHPIVENRFDFSWRPNPKDPPYIYVFGNNQYSAEEMPTVEYTVEGATEYKYVTDIVATLGRNMNNWEIPENIDVAKFDFSWVPHPKSPPYIYQFGTKLDNNDGPRYVMPDNNGEVVYLERVETDNSPEISVARYYIETTLDDLVSQHPNEIFWALRKNIDYTNFDFMWRPGTVEVAWELEYVHVFGSMDSELTQTYFVSANHYLTGNTSFKYVEEIKLDQTTLSQIFIKPDMFYVDKGNKESAERFEILKEKFGNKIQKTRYLNSWVDTINRCINRATTDLIWVLNSELDYTNFNFDYYPNPWQMKMVQVFGTQWSHWGTTFMVNRESFIEDTKYVKIIEHLSTLNFVKDTRATATNCVYDVVVMDHGNDETANIVEILKSKVNDKSVTTIKYDTSYLNTIRQYVNKLPDKKDHYLWLCSSICDYNSFDFTYICDPFARDNLHVFPSGRQKFGDTFLVDVNKTKEIINELDSLENYYKVNYNNTLRVERLPAPEIVTSNDTLVEAVKSLSTQNFPYSIITTEDNVDLPETQYEPINLWAPDTKNIITTTTGNSRIIAPREVADHVEKELYDYPYIKRAPKLVKSNPMDIVFLSNGEACANEHYEHLLKVTDGLPNRVVRVDGVNGRAAAYHAAAEASNTPWMFTVFAKLKVSPKFDWNWQPDRMQVPKHYIFHAKNPVNGLTYGHQAMIAYNKKLTLANEGRGLDFTLDDEHEIVPLISGTAHYNTDPFSTWRTAFREVLKLKADDSEESRVRLDAWLNKAEGDYSEYSIKGALDAEEYYEEVEGDFNKLKLSYEWAWLRKRFEEL